VVRCSGIASYHFISRTIARSDTPLRKSGMSVSLNVHERKAHNIFSEGY